MTESILCFDVSSSSLILGIEDGSVMLWSDVMKKRSLKPCIIRKKQKDSSVNAVQFSSGNIIFVVTSKSVETYDTSTQRRVLTLNESNGAPRSRMYDTLGVSNRSRPKRRCCVFVHERAEG